MSVRQENRYRKLVIERGREALDRQREAEAMHMTRGPRMPAIPPAPVATRSQVRAWMRCNADEYDGATQLAEAANVEFDLPGEGLDDETHWVWDEAALATGG